jgi:hypothetical protein
MTLLPILAKYWLSDESVQQNKTKDKDGKHN